LVLCTAASCSTSCSAAMASPRTNGQGSEEKIVHRGKPNGKLSAPTRSLRTMESLISCASAREEYVRPDQTLIVFDWDDTLCPSHWIRSNRPALQYFSPCPNDPRYKKPLNELSEVVAHVLRLASEYGQIVIITNAQVNWVETSAKNFMPSVYPLLTELNCSIVYARAKFEMDLDGNSPKKKKSFGYDYNANAPQQWKDNAFFGELSKFYSRYDYQSWKNVISIGDQACERDAVRMAKKNRPDGVKKKRSRVKTLKLLEEPSIEDLTAQLQVVQQWLQGIVMYDGDIDVDLAEDDDVIFEFHKKLVEGV